MSEKRFIIREDPGDRKWFLPCNEVVDTQTGRVLGRDRMEPEDACFTRSLAWVVEELNRVHEENNES